MVYCVVNDEVEMKRDIRQLPRHEDAGTQVDGSAGGAGGAGGTESVV